MTDEPENIIAIIGDIIVAFLHVLGSQGSKQKD